MNEGDVKTSKSERNLSIGEVHELKKRIESDVKLATKRARETLSGDQIYLVRRKRFYSTLLLKCNKIVTTDVPIAGVNIIKGKMMLYIHPINYQKLEKRERVAVLIHEILHLALGHVFRRKGRDPYLWNIACDAAINPLIPNDEEIGLPVGAIFPSGLRKKYGVDVPDVATAEKIYSILKQQQDKIPKDINPNADINANKENEGKTNSKSEGNGKENTNSKGDNGDWHSKWEKSEGNEKMNADAVKNSIKESFAKHAGDLPGDLRRGISSFLKSKRNWSSIFRMITAKYVQSYKISTYKRENRRLGDLAKGKRTHRKLSVIGMVDTSASIKEEDLHKFAGELMTMYRTGAEITIIEFDSKVQSLYKFTGKIDDFKIKGGGGTNIVAAFEKINEEKMKTDIVICLTDGDGPAPDVYKKPLIWLLTQKGKVPYRKDRTKVDYGHIIKMED